MTSASPLRIIDSSREDAAAAIAELRRLLSPQGDIVSPKGREKTVAVFGAALTPREVAAKICGDVQSQGAEAVFRYTRIFDDFALDADNLRVSPDELWSAYHNADPSYLDVLRRVRDNIVAFQTAICHHDVIQVIPPGRILRQRYRPLKRVGVLIPGGAAAYPSSLLMTVVPAQTAGVAEIVVVAPPSAYGAENPDLRAACALLGVKEMYRVGGAQAVAMLAYGIEGVPPVDKIVGPGNLFVALAKQHVYGHVDIDSIAGPSEVIVLADASARPDYVAADLISQAEHSPGSGILITWVTDLPARVNAEIERQLAQLGRGDLARASLNQYGAIILARDEDEAVALTNLMAPEHLHVSTADPDRICDRLTNAGAIFLGHDAPVATGDYAAGPSHVLPTGGTARWASGLCVNDFLKRTSIIRVTQDSLRQLAPLVRGLADKEGLSAHRHSVDIRLQDLADG